MILFVILTLIAVICTVLVVVVAIFGGAVGVVLFGDVIVCVAIIIWILKRRINKNR